MPRSTSKPQSGTRSTRTRTGTTSTGPLRFPRLRTVFWFGLYTVLLVFAVGLGGRPPSLQPGSVAPHDITAAVSFNYMDEEQYRIEQEAAQRNVPAHYRRKERWSEEVLGILSRLFKAVQTAESEDSLRASLRDLGVEAELDALIALRNDRGDEALDRMFELVRAVLADMDRVGILSERRFSEERLNGREKITVVERGGRTRELALGKDAIGLEESRKRLGAKLDTLLADFPPDAVNVVKGRLMREIAPNLVYSPELTRVARDEAAEDVPEVHTQVAAGDVLARKGEVIDAAAYRKVREARRAEREAAGVLRKSARWLALAALVAVVIIPSVLLLRLSESERRLTRRRILALSIGLLLVIAVSRVLAGYLFVPALSPVVLFGLSCGMVFTVGTSFTVTVASVLLITLAVGEGIGFALAMTTGTLAGIISIREVSRRSSVLTTGALTGCVIMAGLLGWSLVAGNEDLLGGAVQASYGLLNGLISGAVLAGLMPVVEYVFDSTTRISLLELSDQEHPALRDLLLRAPGTYHHSLILGNLTESCARAIGADALFTRVASYYHDIGKMTKPEYFVENQPPGRSPHEVLSPSMSALVIVSHVKDGPDLAEEYGLPVVIRDVIQQHHGTTLVEFFYRRALEEQEESKGRTSQRLFRYPGPLPQTREAALVMLADSVEAASRSLEEPSPAHIENLVSGIIQRRLLDGQLDESELTFSDLKKVQQTMVRALGSMYHSRPRYPGQETPRGS